jgi:hypothetical protein
MAVHHGREQDHREAIEHIKGNVNAELDRVDSAKNPAQHLAGRLVLRSLNVPSNVGASGKLNHNHQVEEGKADDGEDSSRLQSEALPVPPQQLGENQHADDGHRAKKHHQN